MHLPINNYIQTSRWLITACLLAVCIIPLADVHAQIDISTATTPENSTGSFEQPTAPLTPSELKKWLKRPSTITTSQWIQVMRCMGTPYHRNSFRDQLLSIDPFPAKMLIHLLSHQELAVRLGALELLEEHNATDFGYDPWAPASSSVNAAALDQWDQWLHSDRSNFPTAIVYSGFSREEVYALIQDALNENSPQRAARATRLLAAGDLGVADNIQAYQELNNDLTALEIRTLAEIYYRILIPPCSFIDEVTLAHRLVFGDMDTRARCYQKLTVAGKSAKRVFEIGLDDPNPIVREAAAEALIQTCGKKSIKAITEHIQQEADDDVIYAILRTLGMVKSSDALNLLIKHFKHENEDIALIAIQSAAKLKSRRTDTALGECLSDPRWRIRATALVAIEETKSKKLAEQVQQCLTDEDDFVRYAAIKALPAIMKKRNCKKHLGKLFVTEPNLRIPITEAFTKLDVVLPQSLHQTVLEEPTDVLLSITELLVDDANQHSALLSKLAQHSDTDIACVALRGLANRAHSEDYAIDALTTALLNTDTARKRAVLEFYHPAPNITDKTTEQTWSSGGITANIPIGNDFVREDNDESMDNSALTDLFDAFLSEEQSVSDPSIVVTERIDATPSLDSLFDAFSLPIDESPASPPPEPVQPPSMDSLFDDFGVADDSFIVTERVTHRIDKPISKASKGKVNSLIDAIKKCTQDENEEIAQHATIALLAIDPKGTIQTLSTNYLQELTSEQQKRIADALQSRSGEEQLQILKQLLQTPDKDVRKEACMALLSDHYKGKGIRLILNSLSQPETQLHPTDADYYSFNNMLDRNRQAIKKWARSTLDATNTPPEAARIFALAALGAYGRKSNTDILVPYMSDTNEYFRAAALYSLAAIDRDAFFEKAPDALSDIAEVVRLSILAPCNPHAERILEYRNEKSSTFRNRGFRIEKRPGKHRDAAIQMLKQVKDDPSLHVQLAASLGLLACKEKVSPAVIHDQLNRIPEEEKKTAVKQVVDTLMQVAGRLDSSYAGLIPVLKQNNGSSYDIERLEEGFAKKQKRDNFERLARSNLPEKPDEPLPQTALEPKEQQRIEHISTPLDIILFHTPACEECEVVKHWLTSWSNEFPYIQLEKVSILTSKGEELQTAYITEAGSDLGQVGITPFIVTAAGILERNQLVDPSLLHDLLNNAQYITDTNWIIRTLLESNITEPSPEATPFLTPVTTPVKQSEPKPAKRNNLVIIISAFAVIALLVILMIINSHRKSARNN